YVRDFVKTGRVVIASRGNYNFGQYTDDSQLARELLQSFVACRGFDPADYARRIAAIFVEQRVVGQGLATRRAAFRLARGVHWTESGCAPPDAGNGTAMRAGPIGFLFYADPDRMIHVAHDQSRITHVDRRCSAGAIAIAGAVALAFAEDQIDVAEFSAQLSAWVRPFDPILSSALNKMEEWTRSAPQDVVVEISRVGATPDYVSTESWEHISPFVTPSVLWSLYSFLKYPDSYMDAICTAIACGGDVDTTAAMTGAISGARLGLAGLPEHLVRLV